MSQLSDAYREIAERHVIAAKLVLDAGLNEIAVFHCYHALESIACAAISLRSAVPLAHAGKFRRFTLLYRRRPFWRGIDSLLMAISSLRNVSLYPESSTPRRRASLFSRAEAAAFVGRVEGAMRTLISSLDL